MLDNSSSCISPPCPCPPSFTASSFLRQHAISGHSAVECGGLSRRDTGAFSVRVLLLLSSRLVSLRTFKSLAGTRLVVMRCHVNACGRRVCAIIRCVLVVGGAGCPPCPCLVCVCGLWLCGLPRVLTVIVVWLQGVRCVCLPSQIPLLWGASVGGFHAVRCFPITITSSISTVLGLTLALNTVTAFRARCYIAPATWSLKPWLS